MIFVFYGRKLVGMELNKSGHVCSVAKFLLIRADKTWREIPKNKKEIKQTDYSARHKLNRLLKRGESYHGTEAKWTGYSG